METAAVNWIDKAFNYGIPAVIAMIMLLAMIAGIYLMCSFLAPLIRELFGVAIDVGKNHVTLYQTTTETMTEIRNSLGVSGVKHAATQEGLVHVAEAVHAAAPDDKKPFVQEHVERVRRVSVSPRIPAVLLLLLLPASLLATEFPLTVREVLDGDTIVADVQVGLDGLVFHSQTIRLADIDCWETTRRRAAVKVTAAEIERGKKAKADLESLLSAAKVITASPSDKPRDVYGRRLMSLQADGKPVAEYLRSRGHERGSVAPASTKAGYDDYHDHEFLRK